METPRRSPDGRGGSKPTFLSLAPDTRNWIYDLIFSPAQAVTVSSEKGHREVPAAISRTCRQIRKETLPYFLDMPLVIFVIRHPQDMAACREWLSFIPDHGWRLIRGIRIKHSHCKPEAYLPCHLHFELALDNALSPVSFWSDRRKECRVCGPEEVQQDCIATIDLVLKEMCGLGHITAAGMHFVLELLAPLIT